MSEESKSFFSITKSSSSIRMENLIRATTSYVEKHMKGFDASHYFNHVVRVCKIAAHLQESEETRDPSTRYDASIVQLGSLLHDSSDHKYASDNTQDASAVLIDLGAPTDLATKVGLLVSNVSYSAEVRDSERVLRAIKQVPELAIVQDADRLDAIGAVGIGRTFTFGGAKRPHDDLSGTIAHFDEKLELLEAKMKTISGKGFARARTERLRIFRAWWNEEMELIS